MQPELNGRPSKVILLSFTVKDKLNKYRKHETGNGARPKKWTAIEVEFLRAFYKTPAFQSILGAGQDSKIEMVLKNKDAGDLGQLLGATLSGGASTVVKALSTGNNNFSKHLDEPP